MKVQVSVGFAVFSISVEVWENGGWFNVCAVLRFLDLVSTQEGGCLLVKGSMVLYSLSAY